MMKLPPVQNTVLSHVAVKWQISASPYRIFSFVLTVAGNVVGQPLPYAMLVTSL